MENLLNETQCVKEREAIKYKLEIIEAEIIEHEASKNAKAVAEQVEKLDSLCGNFSQIGMWKVKRKLFPRGGEPPAAKKDGFGNLITAPRALKALYVNTYKSRLEHRKIQERFEDIRKLKSEL